MIGAGEAPPPAGGGPAVLPGPAGAGPVIAESAARRKPIRPAGHPWQLREAAPRLCQRPGPRASGVRHPPRIWAPRFPIAGGRRRRRRRGVSGP